MGLFIFINLEPFVPNLTFWIFSGISRPVFLDMLVPFVRQRSIQLEKKLIEMQKLRKAVLDTEDRRKKLDNFGLIRLL